MKKSLSLLLALVMTFSLCIGLISCGNANKPSGDNPSTNNPGGDNPSTNKPFSVDLAGYVANIGNATALGISKKAKTSASPMAYYGSNSSGFQLLSYNTLASDKDTEDKNYIVMSTTDYDANTPEADKTGLTKVTFTKIVTENVTTETTGTKYITANEGTISISATEGFKYTVYYNDSLIYNEVQDNDANDKDSKSGVIVLDNLTDGEEYIVNYKGIGVETTITQDDINGEIDKLCVMNGYTFISFVPIGTSQRPANMRNIEKDVNGYIAYDKENYCSNNSRQSFVIDNDTGYVYPIKDVTIQKLHNNLLYINNLVYDYNIVDDNLNFFPLFTNTTIQIIDYMKDKYGNNYIVTDKISTYDEANKTTYFKKTDQVNYFLSPNNVVLFIGYDGDEFELKEINSNREFVALNECVELALNIKFKYGWSDWIFTRTHNGYAYFHCISDMSYEATKFMRYNISNGKIEYARIHFFGSGLERYTLNSVWIDDNHVVFYTDLVDGSGKLYTAQIWGESGAGTNVDLGSHRNEYYDDLYNYKIWLEAYLNRNDELKPQLLLENCIQEHWNNHTYSDWRLSVSTLTSTNYYKIAVIDGEVCVVNEENYVAPAPQNYTLYPLNK